MIFVLKTNKLSGSKYQPAMSLFIYWVQASHLRLKASDSCAKARLNGFIRAGFSVGARAKQAKVIRRKVTVTKGVFFLA